MYRNNENKNGVDNAISISKKFTHERAEILRKRKQWEAFDAASQYSVLLSRDVREQLKSYDGVYPCVVEFQLHSRQLMFDIPWPLLQRFHSAIAIPIQRIHATATGRFVVMDFAERDWLFCNKSEWRKELRALGFYVAPLGMGLLSVVDATYFLRERQQLHARVVPA